MRVRDTQRQRVYDWEASISKVGDGEMTLPACHKMIKQVWATYVGDDPVPRVVNGRGRRSACYVPLYHEIRLPRSMRSPQVVLHEAAHAILDYYIQRKRCSPEPIHGPVFARLVIDLYACYIGVDRARLMDDATVRGIKLASAAHTYVELGIPVFTGKRVLKRRQTTARKGD